MTAIWVGKYEWVDFDFRLTYCKNKRINNKIVREIQKQFEN